MFCNVFRIILNSGLQEKFRERVSEIIKYYIDDEVRKHRYKRRFIIVNQIIDSINEKRDTRTVCSDFPEDSDEYEALKRIDYREACIKSPFIDRLKTESILYLIINFLEMKKGTKLNGFHFRYFPVSFTIQIKRYQNWQKMSNKSSKMLFYKKLMTNTLLKLL